MVTLPSERALSRVVRQTIYALKRQYGGRIDIYRLNDAETDLRTGEKTIDKDVFPIRRAVILPNRISRDVVQSISQISANKKFVMGSSFDSGRRSFIIDCRDVPDSYHPKNDDWIVYRNRRYDIQDIEEFEFRSGWIIKAQEVFGNPVEQIFLVKAGDYLELSSDASVS